MVISLPTIGDKAYLSDGQSNKRFKEFYLHDGGENKLA